MSMLLLFIDTKCTIIFGHGHYDIFILKQNSLLISKFLSNLLFEKLVNSPKSR